jgi:hypothetical protein
MKDSALQTGLPKMRMAIEGGRDIRTVQGESNGGHSGRDGITLGGAHDGR